MSGSSDHGASELVLARNLRAYLEVLAVLHGKLTQFRRAAIAKILYTYMITIRVG